MNTLPCVDIIELLEGYVLDALDPAEMAQVASHLGECPRCRTAYADLQQTVTALPLALPLPEPPPGLRRRVFAALDGESEATRRRPSFLERLAGLSLRLSPALATVALFVAVAALGWAFTLRRDLDDASRATTALSAQVQQTQQLLKWTAYPDLQVVDLRGTEARPDARGRMFVSYGDRVALLTVYHLPPQEPERAYQLWLIRDGQRTSGGLFQVDAEGNGWYFLRAPQQLRTYQGIGITAEPVGGSPGPTSPRVIGADLTTSATNFLPQQSEYSYSSYLN